MYTVIVAHDVHTHPCVSLGRFANGWRVFAVGNYPDFIGCSYTCWRRGHTVLCLQISSLSIASKPPFSKGGRGGLGGECLPPKRPPKFCSQKWGFVRNGGTLIRFSLKRLIGFLLWIYSFFSKKWRFGSKNPPFPLTGGRGAHSFTPYAEPAPTPLPHTLFPISRGSRDSVWACIAAGNQCCLTPFYSLFGNFSMCGNQ